MQYKETIHSQERQEVPNFFIFFIVAEFLDSYPPHDNTDMDNSGYRLNQWEKALLCKAFSHWSSPHP